MSFAHIQFKKIREEGDFATISVFSPDFNDDREWQEVAELVVNRTDSTYSFTPRNAWTQLKIVPPYIYELNDYERERALSAQFSDYGYGAWSGRIISMLRKMYPRV